MGDLMEHLVFLKSACPIGISHWSSKIYREILYISYYYMLKFHIFYYI